MRKTALLLAAAMLMTVLFNAGIGTGAVAYAAPEDVITFADDNFRLALISAGVDTDSSTTITQGEMAALTALTIDDGLVTDITGIGYASNLTMLEVTGTGIDEIPAEIGSLTSLVTLRITNNSLLGSSGLPSQLWTLTGLHELNLYGDALTTLPAAIGNLTALASLYLQHNSLASLPNEISSLTQLASFTLWDNNLTSISSGMFGGMTSLSSLDLAENYLDPQTGSDDRTQINAIAAGGVSVVYATQKKCPVSLNFNGGTGTGLNPSYYYGESVTLPTATKTGFAFAGWDTDNDDTADKAAGDSVAITPSPVTASTTFKAIYSYTVTFRTQSFGTIGGGTADILVNVDVGGNVSSVPAIAANSGYTSLGWYDGDTAVTEGQILALAITGNKTFTAKYEATGTIAFNDAFKAALTAAGADENSDGFITETEMSLRTSIVLSGGGFTDLTGIGYATSLTSLTLGAGNVTALPSEIGSITTLQTLNLNGNAIASLPASVSGLANLTTLSMSGCGLSAPPSQIPTITSLTSLNLSDNALTALPAWISSLTNLASLNLSGNLLTALPDNCFSSLAALATLNLQSNYLDPRTIDIYVGLPGFADLTTQHVYTITLNLNGGTGSALPYASYYYGESIPLPTASKTNYEFVGWDTDGDGDADTAGAGSATFTPAPPDSATAKSYTAVYHSSDATLSGIGFAGGAISPAFNPAVKEYTITMYDYVGSITLTPAKSHAAATMTINGAAAASLPVTLASSSATSVVTVALTAEDGVTTGAYTITVKRSAAVSLNLTGISRSLGVTWNPAFASGVTSYVALVPVSMGSVTLSVTRADSNAAVTINGVAGVSRAIAVGQGMTVSVPIVVSSPSSTDRTRTYTVTLKRGTTLSGFSAVPKAGGTYMLSPGGTNRMTFQYTMNGPGAVKIEIYRSGKWVQLMARTETSAGAKKWDWDGKVYGKYLAVATYKVRITPSAYGMTGASATISAKIVKYPSVYWKSVPKKFLATGSVYTLCSFRVKYPTNAVVRVYNSKGRIVAVAKSIVNMPASSAYTPVTWNGKATAGNNAGLSPGALVPAGSYTIRIAVGAKVYSKSFKVIRYSAVSFYRLPTTFRATGAALQLCRFRVDYPTKAVAYVVNAAGKTVASVKTISYLPASTRYTAVTWNGKATAGNTAGLSAGALVPTGTYTVRIAVEGKIWLKTIRITR